MANTANADEIRVRIDRFVRAGGASGNWGYRIAIGGKNQLGGGALPTRRAAMLAAADRLRVLAAEMTEPESNGE